jgi:Domain of unknown function (DUF4115)
MARLRVRVELSRGGAGVPLHKLASVVEEARKFFLMLGEDVSVDPARGEWLGFDFDHEALHFTAEYVGPVTAEQVAAFYAAFDGTTPLRRATIAQFARITDAIGEDELIGFGLFVAGQVEPAEWRCLSRRDALRISEEIQLLATAAQTGDGDHSSHLPAVSDSSASLFRRAGRESVSNPGGSVEERLARVESKVDQHSMLITDLRGQSAATEQSFRNLLTAVENFCDQAAQQIERVSPPAIAAPPSTRRLPKWAVVAIAAVLGILAIVASWRMWPARPAEPVIAKAAAPPAPVVPTPAPAVETPRRVAMNIEIDATEPAWVSLTEDDGQRLAVGVVAPGRGRVVEIDHPARLRTGNAGGLIVRLNGKPLGPIGPRGKVREIEFKNGAFTISSPEDAVVH